MWATGNGPHSSGCGPNSAGDGCSNGGSGGSNGGECMCNSNGASLTPGEYRGYMSWWSRPPDQLCAACLGAALRRLPRLTALELGGTHADIAITALKLAITSSAATTITTTATTATSITTRRVVPLEPMLSPPPPLSLSLLERLILDLTGNVHLRALQEVVATGLFRLRQLTLVEQRPAAAAAAISATTGSAAVATAAAVASHFSNRPFCRAHVPERASRTAAAGEEKCGLAAPGEGCEGNGTEDEHANQFSLLGPVLWMLRQRQLRRLSFTSDRSFTTLEPPPSSGVPHGGGDGQMRARDGNDNGNGESKVRRINGEVADVYKVVCAEDIHDSGSHVDGGGSGGGGLCSVRLSFDLSAEALEPLVACLPATVTSLTLNVGILHRPSDVLAAYAAAACRRCQSGDDSASARIDRPPATAAATIAVDSALPPPPPPAGALDSPAWMSLPPHSFLGGLHFLWPALTQLPRVVPQLRELRLGGDVAAACSDHVLRCWAGASGDPDSLATPMVVDPSFNAMLRRHRPSPPLAQQSPPSAPPLSVNLPITKALDVNAMGISPDSRRGGPGGTAAGQPGSWTVVTAPAASHREGGGDGGVDGRVIAVIGWNDWARSLEQVCLMAHGPTLGAALHLRRFMGGLRRLQVVMNGRLTDVAVVQVQGLEASATAP
ncbi:hypothetical protein Vretimale_4374 [Volvox reticuliferus]|uniref:Uncharacterized protein n=1 Tax=Volvox reticuliferus TaxID=1737510 RepID=A0A8J4FHU8_9CHLO|nr:hypothetical protein Vretifemale_2928 [Volvox reticuliferus]GIL99163.1 hypothetical protein Vretimale_4374 [Volvox reticuliferus]